MLEIRSTTDALNPIAPARCQPAAAADRSFASVLRSASAPPTIPGDIDGDGEVSKAEELVAWLRHMSEQLTMELLMRHDEVDSRRVSMGAARIGRLASELTTRIERGGDVTEQDLADITLEAMTIRQEATSRPDQSSRFDDAERQADADIDGRIDWRTDRAALAARRGALAARLESLTAG